METYKGEINELINWGTGLNEETGTYVDGGTEPIPVSGSSIQTLIRKHLKEPFVPYEDKTAGLYRMFSSEAMKNKFINMMDETHPEYDVAGAEKLPLFSFVRPGDMSMRIDFNNNARYIIEGDSSSELANLDLYLYLEKTQAGQIQPSYDTFTVTYTITDGDSNVTVRSVPHNQDELSAGEDKRRIRYNVFNYLRRGTNSIKIRAKADNSDAYVESSVVINLVNFTLDSTFDYRVAQTLGSSITVPLTIRKSVKDLTLKVSASVDGVEVNSWTTNSNETVINKFDFSFINTFAGNTINDGISTHIKHLLRIDAELSGGASNTTFHSNSLFYEFETAGVG